MKRTAACALIISLLFILIGCTDDRISLDSIPDYSGEAYVVINGGEPFFEKNEITDTAFEKYSPLDPLGRCGAAFASIGKELMPTEERGSISSVKPSGWEFDGKSNNNEYDFGYIYNRSHLIGWQLTGEDATEENLITGTVYMNTSGMLPFENMVADYIKETENHVMYRATPIYDGYNLVASGVLIEALSVEDGGEGIKFCVYVYNVQPDIEIDYYTGKNRKPGEQDTSHPQEPEDSAATGVYILNKNSKKFHLPNRSCSDSIKEENREEYNGSADSLIEIGYSACGICKPDVEK